MLMLVDEILSSQFSQDNYNYPHIPTTNELLRSTVSSIIKNNDFYE